MRRAVLVTVMIGTIAVVTGVSQPQFEFTPGVLKGGDVPKSALAMPPLKAAPGFAATVLVPPGRMFDPLFVIPRPDGTIWVNDDGDVDGTRGGDIWAVDRKGVVSVLVGPKRGMPSTGFDMAPPGFGSWGGQILTVGPATVVRVGVYQAHAVERVSPTGTAPSTRICTLPDAGKVGGGAATAGVEARFGPPGSPFANRFFSVALGNNTVYQTTPDGNCRPFVTFSAGSPWGIAFTPDGSRMLVVVRKGSQGLNFAKVTSSQILSVQGNGTIDPTPVFENRDPSMFDVEIAPAGFGSYGGQLFFTNWGNANGVEREDGPQVWDGTLYRIGPDKKAHLVASGFSNPSGIAFAGNSIFVADTNRDGPFYERSWVPDGFIVRIDLR